jgi:hypothetical protein
MFAASQGIFADTRLQIPVIPENTQVYNNLVIIHGCDDPVNGGTRTPVFGQSVVFPDGKDSIITADGADSKQPLSDFIENWGNYNKKIQSNDVFPLEDEKTDQLGNVVGFWGGNGKLPGVNYVGLNPFVTDAVPIVSTSCAKSVTFELVIADVCKMTSLSGFNTETVNVWTPVIAGSNYNGTPETNDGYDSPATLTVTRNLAANPLPASCGPGVDVVVKPSASQINRDMPVVINGKQEWPLLQ